MKRRITLSIALALSVALLSAAAVAQAPSCFPVPAPGCLYLPPNPLPFQTTTHQKTYNDVAGLQRTIEFAIRRPVGLPGPLPVVIWSHGGNDGKSNPLSVGVEWSERLVGRGYIVVSIAHEPRSRNQQDRLCDKLGYSDAPTCARFNYLNWDRPHDISAVIDRLDWLNTRSSGEFLNKFDLTQLAVAGHSAGTGGVMSLAGAIRDFATVPAFTPFAPVDQRPKVFMAFSPQQPGLEGFYDTDFKKPNHSWESITRPVLMVTGDGDNLCLANLPGIPFTPGDCRGQMPFGRRIPFERMPAGNKYRLYFHDADIFHGLFDLNVSKCPQKNVDPAKCTEFERDLSAIAFAFLDSHLKGIPFATAWLNSNNIELATLGIAEYSRK